MGMSLVGTLAQIRRFCNVTDFETGQQKNIYKKNLNKPIHPNFPSLDIAERLLHQPGNFHHISTDQSDINDFWKSRCN